MSNNFHITGYYNTNYYSQNTNFNLAICKTTANCNYLNSKFSYNSSTNIKTKIKVFTFNSYSVNLHQKVVQDTK